MEPPADSTPPPQPRAGLRRGPRPLLMHLALAALRSSGSSAGWPSSNDDWQTLLTAGLHAEAPAPVPVPARGGPDAALIHGIAAYRRHPWTRDVADPPASWQEGGTRLLDYGGRGDAPPLLIVPSLVNRATIIDLSRERSMARFLAAQGLRVWVLDWGWPGEMERGMDLDALITGRLARAIERVGGRVTLVGYCMGGLLALAAAQLMAQHVSGLALLATPWDFYAGRSDPQASMVRMLETLEPMIRHTGTLPIDALQMLFSIGDLHAVGDKYRAFGRSDQTTPRAAQFVAVEDWLNDGVPLAAPVALACLRDWYGANAPMRGQWLVGGAAIDPALVTLPAFVAIPGRDRIVPPQSALPLAALLPQAVVVRPQAGHVGMVAGASAEAALWRPLAHWAGGLRDPATGQPPGFRKALRKARLAP